jgi:signal transduction histidine kinase
VAHAGQQDEIGRLANTFNQMLANLEDAYKKVEHSLKHQRNFVIDVSHELRTPLTTLRGNLGLLLRKPPSPPEEQEDILIDMVEESDRLIRLVNELLLLAHADAERALKIELVAIQPVVEEVVRQTSQLVEGQKVHVDIVPGVCICGDRDALKQIMLILIDNALKFSNEDMHVRIRKTGENVYIQVQDHGKGIPLDEINHIFDRYYRSEDAVHVPGFGLGLPIAKTLVERMNGEISFRSQVGTGSTVTVSFKAAVSLID